MIIRKITLVLLIIALILLAANLTGVFRSMRNDGIYEEKFSDKFGIKLTAKQFNKELDAIFSKDMSDSSRAVETSLLVNRSLAHYWRDEGIKKYNLTVPFTENYILFILSLLNPDEYRKHEFLNWKKAIERGVGLCSQHAIIVSEILNEKGIQAKMIGLSGHVIATARIRNDKWIILDPDYGVNVPYSISQIENDPSVIEPFYKAEGYSAEKIEVLKKIFGKEGNRISGNASRYSGSTGRMEKRSFIAIWILPLILAAPYLISLIINHLKSR